MRKQRTAGSSLGVKGGAFLQKKRKKKGGGFLLKPAKS